MKTVTLTPAGLQTPDGAESVNRAMEAANKADIKVVLTLIHAMEPTNWRRVPANIRIPLERVVKERYEAYDKLVLAVTGRADHE